MPRLPLKKTEKLSIKEAYGKKLGELKALIHFKKTKAGLELSLREHIGKIIDRLDVPELIAISGLTLLIKKAIDGSEELRAKLKTIGGLYSEFETPFGKMTMLKWFGEALGLKKIEQNYEGLFPDWFDWLIAFAIAYVIVKHGGALFTMLGEGAKSLTSIIGLFFT